MPVTMLLVEGELDAQLLQPLLAGRPLIEAAKSSKNALAPRVRTERQKGQTGAHYLRDRDFDHEPPEETEIPGIDSEHEGSVLGWRWARHEIEKYMLEPLFVERCLDVPKAEYENAVLDASQRIRHYQAARWAIGHARSALPPAVKFRTRPDDAGDKEFFLPVRLEEAPCAQWACDHAAAFLERSMSRLAEEFVSNTFAKYRDIFAGGGLDHIGSVLLWFSGKDIMLAIGDWLQIHGVNGPGAFRARLRDWMRANPDDVLNALPEWRALIEALRV